MNKVVEKNGTKSCKSSRQNMICPTFLFNTWLKPLTVYEVVDNVVTIIVPSEQVGLNYISKNTNFHFR